MLRFISNIVITNNVILESIKTINLVKKITVVIYIQFYYYLFI